MIIFLILVVCILVIALVLNVVILNRYEKFTINDFYDKYLTIIPIPVDFYNITAKLSKNHYAFEMNDRFFLDTFNEQIKTSNIKDSDLILLENDKHTTEKLLQRTNDMTLRVLNAKLINKEKFLFNVVYSQVSKMSRVNNTDNIVMESNHIIYRDTKMYAVSIRLITLHLPNTSKVSIIAFTLNGYVFEDKLTDYTPINLIDDNYQDFKKDKWITKDSKYEKTYLCQYFADLKKFRGIVTDMDKLQCN